MFATRGLVFWFLLVASVMKVAPGSLIAEDVMKECAEKFDLSVLTIDSRKEMGPLPDDPDEHLMCFHECLLTGDGTMKNGVFQADTLKSRMTQALTEKKGSADQAVIEKVLACGQKTAEGKCATAYAIFKCMDEVIVPVFLSVS